jgi:hypothetical protein
MNVFKTILIYAFLIGFTACTVALDESKAKAVVENLLQEIDNSNYKSLKDYYTTSFYEGEPSKLRNKKYLQLKEALGGLMTYEVLEVENISNFGEPAQILLTYRIQRTRVSSIEKFVVIKEDGAYKVSSHGITNE